MRYLARSTQSTTTAMPIAIPPVAVSVVTASESGVQASNSRSTSRLPSRASPRVRSRVGDEQLESAWKRRRSSTGAESSRSKMTHVDNQGRRDTEDVPDYKVVFVKLRQNVDFETRCPIIAGYP
jgi:hypothetical protein